VFIHCWTSFLSSPSILDNCSHLVLGLGYAKQSRRIFAAVFQKMPLGVGTVNSSHPRIFQRRVREQVLHHLCRMVQHAVRQLFWESLSHLFARLSRLLHTQTEFFRGVCQTAVVFACRVRFQVRVCWYTVVIVTSMSVVFVIII
jgi:hypothetical protein